MEYWVWIAHLAVPWGAFNRICCPKDSFINLTGSVCTSLGWCDLSEWRKLMQANEGANALQCEVDMDDSVSLGGGEHRTYTNCTDSCAMHLVLLGRIVTPGKLRNPNLHHMSFFPICFLHFILSINLIIAWDINVSFSHRRGFSFHWEVLLC